MQEMLRREVLRETKKEVEKKVKRRIAEAELSLAEREAMNDQNDEITKTKGCPYEDVGCFNPLGD